MKPFLGERQDKNLSVEKDSPLFSRLLKKNRSSSSYDEMIDSSIVDCYKHHCGTSVIFQLYCAE
jgi:hypothetical protein